MTKRKDFMVQFNFAGERAGEFFQLFAPFMPYAENFECTTVRSDAAPERLSEPRVPEKVVPLRREPPLVQEPKAADPTPTRKRGAYERFRMAERGTVPTARELIKAEFQGRERFHIREAIELLSTKSTLSPNTAAPTLVQMVNKKNEAVRLGPNEYRLLPLNGNGGNHEGESPPNHN